MTYAAGDAVQAALYDRLRGDAGLAALVGAAVHDRPPEGALPPLYVLIGPEEVRDASDATGGGARHDVTVTVIATAAGFAPAKAAAAEVSRALTEGAPPALARGRVVGIWFLRARSRIDGAAGARRIDLRFRLRIED